MKILKTHWPTLLIFLLGLLIASVLFRKKNGVNLPFRDKNPEDAIREGFMLTNLEPIVPMLIAQAKHETGGFKSRAYRELNNMFGMKNALLRQQLGESALPDIYRKYSSRLQCARDMLLYLRYRNLTPAQAEAMGKSPLLYASWLKEGGYFEAPLQEYVNGLTKNL